MESHRDVPFGVSATGSHLRGQISLQISHRGINRHSESKHVKDKTGILSKLLHPFHPIMHTNKDYQILFVGGPNLHATNARWRMVISASEKSRMVYPSGTSLPGLFWKKGR